MTPISTRVREIVADLSGAMIETVQPESRIANLFCPVWTLLEAQCMIGKAIQYGTDGVVLSSHVQRWIFVSDIIRFLEARESAVRG